MNLTTRALARGLYLWVDSLRCQDFCARRGHAKRDEAHRCMWCLYLQEKHVAHHAARIPVVARRAFRRAFA